ncbi:hypothetical protein EYF80_061057 [Liparis tanakae]|uniref:Uncharacterized protein n=1 Tax=Liparis tanakae TaxID=230148 RepID=A0A4Z2EJ68_9TELE|nr:hypothetical protein EYF80_061057 [Liparis tanakae]
MWESTAHPSSPYRPEGQKHESDGLFCSGSPPGRPSRPRGGVPSLPGSGVWRPVLFCRDNVAVAPSPWTGMLGNLGQIKPVVFFGRYLAEPLERLRRKR